MNIDISVGPLEATALTSLIFYQKVKTTLKNKLTYF